MTERHEFEQSSKPIRVGSRVLLVYPAGDADIAVVTALGEYPKLEVRIETHSDPQQLAQPREVTSYDLAPFEDEDMDDDFLDELLALDDPALGPASSEAD